MQVTAATWRRTQALCMQEENYQFTEDFLKAK
jgi:hypothetical protein